MARRPNTITARIALDGGAEIEKELKALGLAGEVAFRKLQEGADKLKDVDGFTASLQRAQRDLDKLGKSFERVGTRLRNTGRNLSFALSAPIVGGFGLAIAAATDFEAAMADVQKVVDFPTPESLTTFGEEIRKLAPALNVANEDLLAIAAAAGQSGVAFEDLLQFTALVAKASVALELSFAETGESLAKIKTSLGLTVPELKLLADAFNELGDASGASEAEIIGIVQEIGPLAKQAGITREQLAALGSTMVSMGSDPNEAATAIRNMVLALVSGASATAPFREALAQIGLDSVAVAESMQRDGIGTILDIFDRIQKQAPATRLALINALFDKRAVAAISGLTGNLGELRRQLGLVARETEFAGSVNQTFALRAKTASFQFGALRKDLDNLAVTIGHELLPVAVELAEKLADFVKGIGDSDAVFKRWGIAIAAVTAAAGPFVFVIGEAVRTMGWVFRRTGDLIGVLAKLRTSLMLAAAGGALAFGPASAIVVGLSALAGLFVFLATRQTRAQNAADAHATALLALDDIVRRIETGIPGATEELEKWKKENIEAGKAALENARNQIQALKAVAEAELAATVGPSDPETLNRMIALDPAVQRQSESIDQLSANVAEAEARLRSISAESPKVAKSLRDMGDTAVETGEKVKKAFPGPAANIRTVGDNPFAKATEGAEDLGAAAETEGRKAQVAFGKVVSVTDTLGPAASRAGSEAKAALDDTATSAGALAGNVRQVPVALTEAGTAATTALEPVNAAFDGVAAKSAEVATALPGQFATAANEIADAFATAFGRVKSDLDSLVSAVTAAISRMSAALARLKSEIASTNAAASSTGTSGGGGGGSGFWQGGMIRGPGSGTSDSIMARLSNGEYVVRADAVKRYGKAFLDAINSGRFKFDLPQFNRGGIVDAWNNSMQAMMPVPAFSHGGGVDIPATRSVGTVTLNVAGKDFAMQAPVDVVGEFMRFARNKAVFSTGTKPGWRR